MARRIETGKAMWIYGVAGFFDLVQIIVFIATAGTSGLFQTLWGGLGYGILIGMFAASNVPFIPVKIAGGGSKVSGAIDKAKEASNKGSKNSLWGFVALMVIELLPVAGSLVPSLTINSRMTIKASQAEDDAKDEVAGNSNPNTIRPKKGGAQNSNIPKSPNTLREARNRVS